MRTEIVNTVTIKGYAFSDQTSESESSYRARQR